LLFVLNFFLPCDFIFLRVSFICKFFFICIYPSYTNYFSSFLSYLLLRMLILFGCFLCCCVNSCLHYLSESFLLSATCLVCRPRLRSTFSVSVVGVRWDLCLSLFAIYISFFFFDIGFVFCMYLLFTDLAFRLRVQTFCLLLFWVVCVFLLFYNFLFVLLRVFLAASLLILQFFYA
jgi:hypothetical protein